MIVLWLCAVSTDLPKLTQTRWKNLRPKISPNLCCSETNQHTYIEMYKVPCELDWTVCTFVIDMLNYSWTLSLLTEFTAQLKASRRVLSIHHFECRRRLKKAVQSEDQKSRKKSFIYSAGISKKQGVSLFLGISHFGKGSSNVLIWVYNIHFRKRPPSFFPKKLKTFPIKVSHTHLKSEFHPKTLNLWSTTPYKNTIKCLWMPFFIHFAINMEKNLSYCASERNKYFWCLRVGEVFFFCTNYRNSSNEKAFPPHLISQTRCTALTSNEMVGIEMRDGNKKNERIETLATTALLSCQMRLFVHSISFVRSF